MRRQNWNFRLYRQLIWHKITIYFKGIHFCENWIFWNLFLWIDSHLDQNFVGFIFVNAMYNGNFAWFIIRNEVLLRILRGIIELKATFFIKVRNIRRVHSASSSALKNLIKVLWTFCLAVLQYFVKFIFVNCHKQL